MIDPILSLAFALQSNKGVYAMLLGSGVSRAAQIPTGWEIVLDLVGKLAHMQGTDCGPDATAWYRETYGEEPDYSKLLDALAKSREERQSLLKRYFEPTDDEREQRLKQPTAAHRAIARLVAMGFIRVIVTTNFDRLIERAIDDEGITPTVISTPDAVEGALPLIHQQCCVVKIHGDYLDTRIKNTPRELEKYDRRLNKLLDRIFDEFGLIVCGWSADWDPALRAAIQRCKSRRFTLYWAARGKLKETAERLVRDRAGIVIPMQDADHFFNDLAEKVTALEESNQSHPLSVTAAVATVKRLIADGRNRIRLHDLVHEETERVFQAVQPIYQSLLRGRTTSETFTAALRDFGNILEVLQSVCIHGSYWGRTEDIQDFAFPIGRLADNPNEGQGGPHLCPEVRAIPSIILLYSSGISAVARKNLEMLLGLLRLPTITEFRETKPLLVSIDWVSFNQSFKTLKNREREYYPASEWLFAYCRKALLPLIPSDTEYELAFDHFEILRAIAYSEIASEGKYSPDTKFAWSPPGGRYVWKTASQSRSRNGGPLDSLLRDSQKTAMLKRILFDDSQAKWLTAMDAFKECLNTMSARCG